MKIITPERKIHSNLIQESPSLHQPYRNLATKTGCTYITYMFESSDNIYYYTSNPDWKNELIKEKLINHCPIYHNAFLSLKNNESIVTIWDTVPHNKGIECDIKDFRTSFNIAHGVGIALSGKNHRESIVFAGSKDDTFFYEKINTTTVKSMLNAFRSEIHYEKYSPPLI
ncbi:autoinducer binding domain-containing protein [Pantoea sp. BAV 3049]|uniref:autoinducer binding domain-containing protein n=1 Tax=Pantoea sp. BAV 3049 TaxID=2654188 RepID=UPI00131DC332|nr:autoinducer binding domain-containing protein [Pantoea sp. BAV 3049]